MKLTTLPPRPPGEAPSPPPLLVKYAEAARQLGGVSREHVRRLVAAGELQAVGRGKARRIVYASILAYVAREAGHG